MTAGAGNSAGVLNEGYRPEGDGADYSAGSDNSPQPTTAGTEAPQVTTAGIGEPQVTTAGIGEPQVTTAGIGEPQVTTAGTGAQQVTTAGTGAPAAGTDASQLVEGVIEYQASSPDEKALVEACAR